MGEDFKDELDDTKRKIYDLAMAAINDIRPEREKNLFDILIEEEIDRISEVVNNVTQIKE